MNLIKFYNENFFKIRILSQKFSVFYLCHLMIEKILEIPEK